MTLLLRLPTDTHRTSWNGSVSLGLGALWMETEERVSFLEFRAGKELGTFGAGAHLFIGVES